MPRSTALLAAVGDLAPEADRALPAGRYDPALAAAVGRFQARHGLAADGRLGPKTLAQLEVPFSRRLAQIQLTLDAGAGPNVRQRPG